MAEERPEKEVVRQLWLERVTTVAEAFPNDDVPLYLTLSGAEGLDIKLLIERGLLQVTASGAISADHKHRVIAVERSTSAVIALQKKFPGLKIIDQPFHNLVRSDSPFRWPERDDELFCRARVVNLDLDEVLSSRLAGGELRFPVVDWIVKLARIHAAARIDWSLCITLHGEVLWDEDVAEFVRDFLAENFEREAAFEESCRDWLGTDLVRQIRGGTARLHALQPEDQQRLLMVFLPKKVAHDAHHHGWKVSTLRNLRYGGSHGQARMVTWVIDFSWDTRATRRPDNLYRECLREILSGVGSIEEDGSIS